MPNADEAETPEAGAILPLEPGTDLVVKVGFVVPRDRLDSVAGSLHGLAKQVVAVAMEELQKRNAEMPAEPESVPWIPLRRAAIDMDKAHRIAARFAVSLEDILAEEVWVNDRYQVHVRTIRQRPDSQWPPMKHLSIRRHDRAACHDWRDFQKIKNDLVGPDCEAVELYPREDRLADSANQYHLWALTDGVRFPFGFADRLVSGYDESGMSRQRPWADGDEPADLIASEAVKGCQGELIP